MPQEIRGALLDRQTHNALRRRAVDVVQAWARRWQFHGVDVDLGGLVVAHPEGDTDPERWAPHFNVLWPIVGLTADGAPRIGRYHVPPESLNDLRERWARELVDLGWTARCSPQVFYEFRKDGCRKRHALRYFLRGFPSWQAWTHRVVWWGVLRGEPPTLAGWTPEPWNDETHRDGICDCGQPYTTTESVSRGRWSRTMKDGSYQRACGPPSDPKLARLWRGEAT